MDIPDSRNFIQHLPGDCMALPRSGYLRFLCSRSRSSGHCEWYALPGVARFGQFGVLPECQGLGVGSRLLDRIESRALELGAVELACDTAEGATHLIEMYSRRAYRLVGHADWEETNYRSVILSKGLGVGLEGGGG